MIIPMTVAEIANATNPVAAKLRRANRRRSAIGAAAIRSSYATKAAKATAAAASRVPRLAEPGYAARERRRADGQVDEEDGPPAQGVGQHPAGQRPDGAGGAERGAEDAQRPGQGGAGELRAQQRRG